MDYNFKIETVEAGQRNKYGDSCYHFVITNASKIDYSEHVVKEFCTKFLKPAKFSEEERRKALKESGDFGLNFASYYTQFEKTGDRMYVYKVVMPSTH